jgi:hypothetical protein
LVCGSKILIRKEGVGYLYYGKVGGSILYALQRIGYSIPPRADCGWIGEDMQGPSYLDKVSGPTENGFTNRNYTFMTYNLLRLARNLHDLNGYPTYGNSRRYRDKCTRWNFENQ